MCIKFINKGGINTVDATATADDIIAPKTAYVNGEKIEGAIIPSYTFTSLSDYKEVNNTSNFDDIDLLNNIAVSHDNDIITLHKLNNNIEVIKSFNVSIDWNTNTTKTIISVRLFKGNFAEGYVIYISVLDTINPYLTITRIVVSKDLQEIVSKVTYNDTYHNYSEKVLDIYKLNKAIPHPVNPYQVAYMSYSYNNVWMFGYIKKLDFRGSPPIVTNSSSFGKGIFDYSRAKQNVNITFDETGNYLSLLLNIDTNYPMNCVNIYYFETMESIISNENLMSSDVRGIPLFNLDGNVYAISQNKLLLLDSNSYTEVNELTDNIIERGNKYITFASNLLLYTPSTKILLRYVLNETRTAFVLQDTLYNVNSFNYYQNGLWCNTDNQIYYWENGTGELSQLEVKNKKLFLTHTADIKSTDVLFGKIAYNAQGKITGSMPNNGELNYTPTTENQIIPAGYTSGGTIDGDSNLLSENIKAGVTIFGVTGTYTGETTSIQEVVS